MRMIRSSLAGICILLFAAACGSDHNGASNNLHGNTTTLAGNGNAVFQDSTDGTGATASFNFPRGLATDGTYLYLSESSGLRVRKIDITTGATINLAGDGNLAFRDSTDGTGATAQFMEPRQITYLNNYLYLADYKSNRIRKIDVVTGETTTLAGDGTAAYQDSTDGTGATAQFKGPCGITNDGTSLYVIDRDDYHLRKVDPATGNTITVAGNGVSIDQESTDNTGATAGFAMPFQVAVVGDYLYVGNTARIHKVHKTTGNSVFFAGGATEGYQDSTDGTGATAQFNVLLGLCSDGLNLFAGDAWNNRVRRVSLDSGNTATVAGDGTAAFQDSTDGTGATAQFNSPRACVHINGVLYVADGGNHRVRKVEL